MQNSSLKTFTPEVWCCVGWTVPTKCLHWAKQIWIFRVKTDTWDWVSHIFEKSVYILGIDIKRSERCVEQNVHWDTSIDKLLETCYWCYCAWLISVYYKPWNKRIKKGTFEFIFQNSDLILAISRLHLTILIRKNNWSFSLFPFGSESWVYIPHFWLFSSELTNSLLLS